MVAGLNVHWHTDLSEIDTAQWDALAAGVDGGSPFLRLAFFRAMVDSGSACPDTGWHPLFLTVQDDHGQLLAGCPLFVKEHSYGEYVFDWAWADDQPCATQRAAMASSNCRRNSSWVSAGKPDCTSKRCPGIGENGTALRSLGK